MFFFFSSRRRHTRLQGDWSSDVCSSDLLFAGDRYPPSAPAPAAGLVAGPARLGLPITIQVAADGHGRSEQRSADSEDDSFSHGVTSGGEAPAEQATQEPHQVTSRPAA